jgi:ABC-type ATPase with predicted acetyltransferase domain
VTTYNLLRADEPLVADVDLDPITEAALKPFDLAVDAPSEFRPYLLPSELPDDFGIGLIVGASGSGKSILLREFGETAGSSWEPRRSIAAHFSSAEEAAERFYAVGLNSVPVWRLPYAVLSNGQKFRADLARVLADDAVVDEFTSVVDRNVAISASRALRSYVDRVGLRRLVLASCHRDVIAWLRPDWLIDTDAGTLTIGQETERPRWYAEHLLGDVAGKLVLR